ncbi:TPA: hypothetical protein QDB15_000026 [Burkholderia vietnamiensis]|uniref:Uncharacterized protein n=1 Tax=Pandoraea apista TaxID=93218 RepID=A0A5E5P1I7_9BURK|nr:MULTISPECIES: hypothetical protein [Burkholderiaceae]MCA8206300.1 hypothetical protein [Burkholderia vietnamiensis]VVG70431.1 hypothetical protein PAP18089_01391 [Pandoraea apista]HDR8943098.1 hypothetical protein [Burkholderia vietnamiensis]HDR9116302.1 hypothetical protein [Burkholderia vietnamiensis]HDR9205348.1 hypothetical protein [Burkholderia vietnamiensis]
MTTAITTAATFFSYKQPPRAAKSFFRFVAQTGQVFEATSLEEVLDLASEGLGVSLDFGVEDYGRIDRVTLVRSKKTGQWMEPEVNRTRVWPNTPEWQAVRQTLRDVLDAFQNRALVGPCPYDEDGYLPGEREVEAALALAA